MRREVLSPARDPGDPLSSESDLQTRLLPAGCLERGARAPSPRKRIRWPVRESWIPARRRGGAAARSEVHLEAEREGRVVLRVQRQTAGRVGQRPALGQVELDLEVAGGVLVGAAHGGGGVDLAVVAPAGGEEEGFLLEVQHA